MSESKYDLLIKGGQVASSTGLVQADVYIDGEKIAALVDQGKPEMAKETINAEGKYILPGVIDVHTHKDMIVYTDQFQDVSRSAICGGVTTEISLVRRRRDLDMELLDSLKLYIDNGEQTSYNDFSIHGGFIQGDEPVELVPEVVKMGIPSFKMLMAYSARGFQLNDEILIKTMDAIAQNGGMVMIHAENGSLIDYLEYKAQKAGRIAPEDFPPTRPGVAEAEAVYRAYTLARTVGCPIYFVHMSAKESIDILLKARLEKEISVWTETCPQYLTLTDKEMSRWGNLAKIAPPLRKEEDLEAMWYGCSRGIIDVIGSDHAAYDTKAKHQDEPNIFTAILGIPGTESMLSLVHQEGVNKKRFGVARMVGLLSENPAKIFGLFPRKGIIQAGSDADIVIFDPSHEHTISAKTHHSNLDYTVYEGWKCKGGPVLTLLRGQVVSENGELKGEPGYGKFLPREPGSSIE